MKGETEGLMRFWLMMAMVLGLLAGCQDKAPKAPDDGLANYDFHAFDQQKAKCEARDGRFAQGGKSGGSVCFLTPPDAGKSCKKSSDCSTDCLARSGTCAPIAPLFGCNEILNSSGARETLCVD